jgi:hypothetical protein
VEQDNYNKAMDIYEPGWRAKRKAEKAAKQPKAKKNKIEDSSRLKKAKIEPCPAEGEVLLGVELQKKFGGEFYTGVVSEEPCGWPCGHSFSAFFLFFFNASSCISDQAIQESRRGRRPRFVLD